MHLKFLLTFVAAIALPITAIAQTPAWPTKPVKIITGWTPGGNADIVSRLLADGYAKRLSQSFIVDNRPGAAGTIGASAVARSEADGATLLVATMPEVTVVPPATVQTMGYDPEKELTPVTMIGRWPLVLVANPSFPPNTMAELAAYVKAHPGSVNYGSSGIGTINHVTGELLNLTLGIDSLHVAYKGAAPMATDLIGGRIQYAFDSVGAMLPLIKSGKVKPIAVTDTQRVPELPNTPTMAESGYPQVNTGVWMGLFVPAKTPKNVVDAIHAQTVAILNAPDVRKALAERSINVVANGSEAFKTEIAVETAKKRALAERIGIKAE
ncbi:MAG TPA: tripartite tricarboxylate transporter substrate binding protein [Burkholderiales bacterium]|nr:tripartite tricarboxylate transporter substrate binding protein [Burkholderiales bacterium]